MKNLKHYSWRPGKSVFAPWAMSALFILLSGTLLPHRALAEGPVNFPVPPPSSITQVIPPVLQTLDLKPGKSESAHGKIPRNARVNSNLATLGQPQVEPSVASKPANGHLLVAGFGDALADPIAFDFAPGVARSTNGGGTWFAPKGGATLPDPPGFIWGNRILATHLAA